MDKFLQSSKENEIHGSKLATCQRICVNQKQPGVDCRLFCDYRCNTELLQSLSVICGYRAIHTNSVET